MNNYNVKPEYLVEEELMYLLKQLGYVPRIDINNVDKVEENIKYHLERINQEELKLTQITDAEFEIYIKNRIINNDVFANAVLFRDLIKIPRGSNQNIRIKCFDDINFENNVFEYSHQIKLPYELYNRENRGDVTLFLNGFPIVQIELKRSGIDLNEAFNQITRYKQESFDKNIFKILQLFVVSNETLTKYFSNNMGLKKEFMFEWSDENNKKDFSLTDFTNNFLDKKTLFKMLTNYMVLKTSNKEIVTLRPYQFYAVEKILNHIDNTNKLNQELEDLEERASQLNGYVWHATGSGKTLTSFKASQILSKKKDIYKVVFLVDRNDLNKQTLDEFKGYLGSNSDDLEETGNSFRLYEQLLDSADPNKKIIVSTMQKFFRVLTTDKYPKINLNEKLLNENFIFVIDECHRTQFGDMHKLLRKRFVKSRLIGFTGTPIFAQNAKNAMTTSQIFGLNLHKYMMINAIDDRNVLKFIIEYIKGPKKIMSPGNDIEVEDIDIRGFFNSDEYHQKVADYIYKINPSKTKNNNYKSMLVCGNIDSAVKYYWLFRNKYPDFNVAALFSKRDSNQILDEAKNEENITFVKNELDKIILDYNKVYETNCSEKEFKLYNYNVQSKLKPKSAKDSKLNLVIVVRMLTTGFDAQLLNTIYLDRSLQDYEIIQTISRANRLCELDKDYANVVSFRTFKKDVDDAIALYSNGESTDYFFDKEPLESIVRKLNDEISEMKTKWFTYWDVKNEKSEIRIKEFISHMKIINKLLLHAKNFINYEDRMILLTRSELEEFRSVQKDIANKVKDKIYKDQILQDIDFEVDIFRTDEINVDYILNTLNNLKNKYHDTTVFKFEVNKIIESIKKTELKSKAKLIEKFILLWSEKMMSQSDNDWKHKDIYTKYQEFKIELKNNTILDFCVEYNLSDELLKEIIFKKGYENKPINSYNESIRNAINNKELGILEISKLITDIKEFIINANDDNYLDLTNVQDDKLKSELS